MSDLVVKGPEPHVAEERDGSLVPAAQCALRGVAVQDVDALQRSLLDADQVLSP